MREIKFRAWDGAEWITERVYMAENGVLYYLNSKFNQLRPCADNCKAVFYTGLRDRNGVEIFEGDILSIHPYGDVGEVFFSNGDFKFRRPGKVSVRLGFIDYLVETIGNRFENPELLDARQSA